MEVCGLVLILFAVLSWMVLAVMTQDATHTSGMQPTSLRLLTSNAS